MSNTNQLMLFLDVVQQGSFTKAAALHNMDNSALSKQVKKLERDLGVQLLNRSTRSFSLTTAGEEILEQAIKLKDTINHIQFIADSYQSEPKGVLRITSPIYFGHGYLQPVISKFMKTYPDVQIVHVLSDKKNDIISENIDLAFRLSKLEDSNLIAKKIADTNFILIASNDFIKEHGRPTTPQDLIALPSVLYTNGDMTIDQLTISNTVGSPDKTTYKMKGNYKVSDVRTTISAVRDGLGYALIELSNLHRPLDELGLTLLLPEHEVSTRDTAIYAVYPHRKHTKLAKLFVDEVQAYIGTPPRWLVYLSETN
ncbi:LysR family transcriptional regulator [Vibrio makurazakiensis]|uniref:LysR family transcriptional regulator n=1 Tax=Vibrio makurazakiensis TaxID=2910250 RepID=UPI003D110C91